MARSQPDLGPTRFLPSGGVVYSRSTTGVRHDRGCGELKRTRSQHRATSTAIRLVVAVVVVAAAAAAAAAARASAQSVTHSVDDNGVAAHARAVFADGV